MNVEKVKDSVLNILAHPEAEEGLYLENFTTLHEEDERPCITEDQLVIINALESLIAEGKVAVKKSEEKQIFILS